MQPKRKLNTRTKYQIIGSIIFGIGLVVRIVWPTFKPDNITLLGILLIIFLWLGPGLFKSVTGPGGVGVEFKDEDNLKEAKTLANEAIRGISSSNQPSIKWDKVATLFWFANDLMWVKHMTYLGESPSRVLEGVGGVIEYAEELGFAPDSFPIRRLNTAKQELQKIENIPSATEGYTNIIQLNYRRVRQEIESVKWFINELAVQEKQKGFIKRRSI